jgi:hypothetical protein
MNNLHRHRAGLLIASVALLTVMSGTSQAADSGIEGVISVSPSRPGPQRVDEPSKAPVANTAFVVQKGEEKVASFTTDAHGHFQVSLPPGHYIITRTDPGARIGHWHFEADVVAGKMAAVDWTGDSGMR